MTEPADPAVRDKVLALIAAQSTMTLATAREGAPWAAPVYYVYLPATFYFFSDPDTRHIQEALENRSAAAAVFADSKSWREIRGIQMSGTVTPVTGHLDSLNVIQAYLRKFPFTREFFSPGDVMNPSAFLSRFRVRLYGFSPHRVVYVDNGIRFGFKTELALSGH
jgi:uncharacterized protein YhbP (UPF0306 family)